MVSGNIFSRFLNSSKTFANSFAFENLKLVLELKKKKNSLPIVISLRAYNIGTYLYLQIIYI